ncbi:MAG TPA: 3-methyl-2-oxobutanoate hydroxymethyltransferase [Gemmatimonadaceae bacterium]|nr:3-methyl-2-oxobutanoate hydroxymethyltransferase [Gemmatimonadaceae bacterium]
MPRITVPEIRSAKGKRKLVSVTAYDAPMAKLAEQAGVELLLVGDSVAMVVLGRDNTLEVTMDEMLHHTRAVVRGSERAHVVLDMPFMSYQTGEDDAMRNAGRALKEAGASSIKLEGGSRLAPLVSRLVDSGVPVMGHIGLQPQSVNQVGGFVTQGRDTHAADVIIADAIALADAGAYAMVIEKVPVELAEYITKRVPVPTIGIGCGPHCDGQVLVVHDALGFNDGFHPRHAKQYLSLAGPIRDALTAYVAEVRDGRFPAEEHAVHANAQLAAHLKERV